MTLSFKKLSLMIVTLFAITSVFADSYKDDSCPKKPSFEQGHAAKDNQMMPGYNSPARIDVQGAWDFFITGTFLWWEPRQGGMELGETNYTNGASQGSILKFDFDYKPAFKVGLGYNLEHDNWSLYLEYTRMNMDETSTVNRGSANILNSFWHYDTQTLSAINSIKGKWDLDFNMFDFEIGRFGYTGTHLTVQPFAGLKGGWIDQKYDVTATQTANSSTANFKTDSWLVGPRIGANIHWLLGEGFRLETDAAFSLFYQKFRDVDVKEPQAGSSTTNIRWSDYNIGQLNRAYELLFALGWGTYFDRHNWHFDILAGYEVQIFTNQNMMSYINEAVTGAGSQANGGLITKPGDLMLHGLTLSIKFDF